jgi:hypothetical protein
MIEPVMQEGTTGREIGGLSLKLPILIEKVGNYLKV